MVLFKYKDQIANGWDFASASYWYKSNSLISPNSKATLYSTGIETTFKGKKYIHFQGEKIVEHRLKNIGKAIFWTVATLGIGILFSSSIQRYWTKGLFGVAKVSYFVNKKVVPQTQKDLSDTARTYLRDIIKSQGISPYYRSEATEVHTALIWDPELVIQALKEEEFDQAHFIPEELKKQNQEVMASILKFHPDEFQNVNPSWKKDPNFIILALSTNPSVEKFIDFKLFENNQGFFVMLLRATHNFSLLQYASPNILDNGFINQVKVYLRFLDKANISKIVFNEATPDIIRGNLYFITELTIMGRPDCIRYATDTIRNDRSTAQFFIKCTEEALQFISDDLREDSSFVTPLVTKSPSLIEWVSPDLSNYRQLALEAIQKDPHLYKKVSIRLQRDPSFLEEALQAAVTKKDQDLLNISWSAVQPKFNRGRHKQNKQHLLEEIE